MFLPVEMRISGLRNIVNLWKFKLFDTNMYSLVESNSSLYGEIGFIVESNSYLYGEIGFIVESNSYLYGEIGFIVEMKICVFERYCIISCSTLEISVILLWKCMENMDRTEKFSSLADFAVLIIDLVF